MIEIRGLAKAFGSHRVLNGVDLSIESGEVVAVVGPSGTGKSTLLRCLNRLERPDAGTITFGERSFDLSAVRGKELVELRKRTGMVFQGFNLFAKKTALENVMEGLLVVKRLDKVQAEQVARRELDRVGLADRAGYYPRHLSGGQQQRVAIARALAMSPDLLLLDEPTSALDPELVGEVLTTIRKAASDGYTMLLVSHEMDFVRNVAENVIFLDGGSVLEQGAPEEVLGHPKHERVRAFALKMSRLSGPEYVI